MWLLFQSWCHWFASMKRWTLHYEDCLPSVYESMRKWWISVSVLPGYCCSATLPVPVQHSITSLSYKTGTICMPSNTSKLTTVTRPWHGAWSICQRRCGWLFWSLRTCRSSFCCSCAQRQRHSVLLLSSGRSTCIYNVDPASWHWLDRHQSYSAFQLDMDTLSLTRDRDCEVYFNRIKIGSSVMEKWCIGKTNAKGICD